ncbi:hypothetical protein ABZ464_24010 [Streptomyces sp. NPDC005820]|uniref:hypothetical protein n=1 Tax=Streptomyces sp. NPDC005820 TaxID=3157069 RepID=UPI0034042A42
MAAEQMFYYEFPGGAVQERVTSEASPQHPADATLLTEDEYNSKRQAVEAALEQNQADIQAQETARKKAAYDALVAGGFDTGVAQTLSGYTPPQPMR